MENKIIYLAGAMQVYGNKGEKAKEWRNRACEYLTEYYNRFICVNPTDYYEYGSDYHKTNREVMRFDLRKVRESDILLVNLKDIRQSIGTNDEIFYAYMSDKPIIGFLEEDIESRDELIKYVHEWKYEQIDRIETGKDALRKACVYIGYYYGRE